MKKFLQLMATSTLALGVVSGPLFVQAQEKTAPAKDETKMDAKGIPGSPDTQSGKAPAEASGSSATQGSGTAESTTDKQAAPAKDETKMDAKGVPGSQTTQSGKAPAEASGSSGTKSSGTYGATSSSDKQAAPAKDETKMDAKGVPGSQTTQSGESPPSAK